MGSCFLGKEERSVAMDYTEFYERLCSFRDTGKNALSYSWLISPLIYFSDDKKRFDSIFKDTNNSKKHLSDLPSVIFMMSMDVHIRANYTVLGFMKLPIAKLFSFEFENGLFHLYKLDFISCISSWIYIIEGYLRVLFQVNNESATKPDNWIQIDTTHLDEESSQAIEFFQEHLQCFLESFLFAKEDSRNEEIVNRHLLLHGKIFNKDFFNQGNALKLLFVLDLILTIELTKEQGFPFSLSENKQDLEMINIRKELYQNSLSSVFDKENLKKIQILQQHLIKD